MSRDTNTDDRIKRAAQEAMDTKYSWAEDWDDAASDHEFSEAFLKKMEKTCRAAEHSYVSLGRFRMRKGRRSSPHRRHPDGAGRLHLRGDPGSDTLGRAQNDSNGTLDVYFDIDDPDSNLTDKGLRKPETPEGYEIVSEDRDEGSYYMIEYICKDSDILYMQESGIENLGLTLNNEDNDCTEININGYKGYYRKFETGALSLTWTDGIYLYELSGMTEISILKEMAESLK